MGACFSKKGEEEDLAPVISRTGSTHDHLYYHAHTFDRVSYIPEQQRDIVRKVENGVLQAFFVAEDALEAGGNFWSLYLETTGSSSQRDEENGKEEDLNNEKDGHHSSCVRLSLRPSAYPGRHGPLAMLEVKACSRSQRLLQSQYEVTLPPLPGHVPVARFIDALVDGERQNFEFTRSGRGTRGWILDSLSLFLRIGLLVDPDGRRQQELERAVGRTWTKGLEAPGDTAMLCRGTYYRVTSGGIGSREMPWDETGPNEVVYWNGREMVKEARYYHAGP